MSGRHLIRLKYLTEINRRVLPETTDPDYEFRYVDISTVGRGILIGEPQSMTFSAAPSRARRLVAPGDTIVSTVRTYLRSVWPVQGDTKHLVVSTGFTVLTPGPELHPRYLAWWAQSNPFIEEIVARSVGVSYPAINPMDLGNIVIDLPSLDEQRRIADFLDAETSRMDRLLVSLRRLDELLEERRINQVRDAVAGCSAGSTSSSVSPWLGPISPEWRTANLGVISRTYMGTTFPHAYQGEVSGDFPFIKVRDFRLADVYARIATADNWVSKSVARTLGAIIVPAGSVLYARVGAAMLLNQRRLTVRDCVVDDNVRGLRILGGDPRYWLYLLSLLDLGQLSNPGPVPSVSESQVSGVQVPVPSLSEQRLIADSLDAQQYEFQ
jgi:type I restriction enzyme, S subunit